MLPPSYDARVIGRDEAIRLLEEQHAEVANLLGELDDDAFARRGTIGGGEWSAKDLALHLGSWEELARATLTEFARGVRPGVEDTLVRSGDSDRFNDRQVREHLDVAPEEARARFEERHRRIIEAIAETDDAAWAAAYPFDPEDDTVSDRIGSLLGSDAGGFTHAAAHLDDLRAYAASTTR
jgi:Mycothiol maleylpyruvate isomerase N-terminal domain